MNKSDFIKAVADKAEITLKDTRMILDAIDEVLLENLPKEEEIRAFDGVTFTKMYRQPRMVRNPSTGEMFETPGKYVPKTKFGKKFKEAVV